jgi:hypothetical protein
MYGHEGIVRDLKRRLEQRLPARLNSIRVERGSNLRALPNPAQILGHFIPDIDVDQYPTIAVTELDTPTGLTGAREIQQGMQADAFVYRYPVRIFVHVRSVDYGITELQLKRYLTAVRETILENRILTETDEAYVTFDPSTLREVFDGPIEADERQILGVGFVGVVLESTELINKVPSTIDTGDLPTTDGPFAPPYTLDRIEAEVGHTDREHGGIAGTPTQVPIETTR